ncbi:MAG: hypothetical protein ACT4PL_02625 [Phycisphaerales bacterium]
MVEVLLVLAIVLALAALFVGPIAGSRISAQRTAMLSNMRTLATLQVQYCDDHRGEFAVLFAPVYRSVAGGLESVRVGERTLRGAWFENANWNWLVAAPDISPELVLAPGNPRIHDAGSSSLVNPDYVLTNTLFASPEYWDLPTQTGPNQWRVQRIDSIAYPADKGLLLQMVTYELRDYPDGHMSCCFREFKAGLVWADLSASRESIGAMPLGSPNPWHHTLRRGLPSWSRGAPVLETRFGVAGRDRGPATTSAATGESDGFQRR